MTQPDARRPKPKDTASTQRAAAERLDVPERRTLPVMRGGVKDYGHC